MSITIDIRTKKIKTSSKNHHIYKLLYSMRTQRIHPIETISYGAHILFQSRMKIYFALLMFIFLFDPVFIMVFLLHKLVTVQ